MNLIERIEKLERGTPVTATNAVEIGELRQRIDAIEKLLGITKPMPLLTMPKIVTAPRCAAGKESRYYIVSKPRTQNGKRLFYTGNDASPWTDDSASRYGFPMNEYKVALAKAAELKTPDKKQLRPMVQNGPCKVD